MDRDNFSLYLQEIGRIPLLTADEEIHCCRTLQKARIIEETIPQDERTKAHRRQIRAGRRARDRVIKGNLRLVVHIAMKWQSMSHDLDIMDLVQEGNLGLHRAVELFDPERGYKFSTYAYWWVRQAVSRGIAVSGRTIRLPIHALECLSKARRGIEDLTPQLGRPPTLKELARYLQIEPEKLGFYLDAQPRTASLDAKVNSGDPDHSSLGELIADELTPTPADHLLIDNLHEQALELFTLANLDERDQKIMRLYYGLDGELPMGPTQIGERLGCSRTTAKNRVDLSMARLRRMAEHRIRDQGFRELLAS